MPSTDLFKVSIIVPSYNHAAYLLQRLDSILAQTYQHFELIILDDASPDNSREIIEPYREHPKVSHIIYNKTNSGTTFRQWDRGIQLAGGSLVWIAESDDWCEPAFLETIVQGFRANPHCVLGYTQAYAVNNEGDILWQSSHNKLSDQMDGKAYVYQYLGRSNTIFNASMAVFKRDAFYAVSKDYLSYRFSGDWLFWTEIARQGDVFISGRLLSYFRNHEADVSGKAYASGLNYLEDLRVWAALRKDRLIDEPLYKEVLVKKYAAFVEAKPFLAAALGEKIEQLFMASGCI